MAPRGRGTQGMPGSARMLELHSKTVEGSRVVDPNPFGDASMPGQRRLLVPPLGEGSLANLIEIAHASSVLEQCFHAFETNIDGFGHRFELVGGEKFPKAKRTEANAERERLEEFFTYAWHEGSFVALRQRKRRDQEMMGVGYWEVIRDATGAIVRMNHVPAHTVRMTAQHPDFVTITEPRRVGLEQKDVKLSRRFRLFCQIHYMAGRRETIWFKEFGDPRSLHYKTGEFVKGGAGKQAATELMAFPVKYYPPSPYSVPRWIGNLPAVLGTRAADEVNVLYFDNKTIPPLVIMVSGGQLTKKSAQQLRDVFEHQIKGRENFHRALILEALPMDTGFASGGVAAPKIELKPLTDRMLQDAMFMNYDDAGRTKIRSSFRVPPLLTGETQDYNRATSEASRLMAEEQTFRPERMGFDYYVNRWLLPALGSQYWEFRSNGPNVTLNEDLIAALTAGEAAGAMTPNIGRQILSDVFEQDVPQIPEDWGNVPFSLTLQQLRNLMPGLPAGGLGAEGASAQAAIRLLAKRLPAQVKEEVLREVRGLIRQELKRRAQGTPAV